MNLGIVRCGGCFPATDNVVLGVKFNLSENGGVANCVGRSQKRWSENG